MRGAEPPSIPGREADLPTVSVVVPAMNAAQTLPDTLAGLAAQDFEGDFELVVVDDGSDDETAAIATRDPIVDAVIEQTRQGPAQARNRGAEAASAQAIAFLDADCVPAPAWLREGLQALSRSDLVQGEVTADPKALRGPFDRTLWVTRASPLYESANIFVRRELFEALGGFEDWLPVGRGKPLAEDVWFGWRARRTGARLVFSKGASAHHAVFPRGPRGYVYERLRTRYFAAIVKKVPELRREFLFARLFLSPGSARFDAAVAGVGAAVFARRCAPLVAAFPYLSSLARLAFSYRGRAVVVVGAEVAADAVTLGALLFGSVRWRTIVL